MSTFPIPAREDFTSDNETIVWYSADRKFDDVGRIQFTAFWMDEWLTPAGVRGQVFFTNLAEFIARDAERGKTVRVVSA
jgi:hypothetical protein